MSTSNNNNIQLFHHSAGGGNTCWLQSALVLLQGEDDYITAINNYDEIYKDNINSTNTDEKTESKLMHSIKKFLDNKTESNLAKISQCYQNYVKHNNNDTSIANQQDITVSYGGSFDATTFLGHINDILIRNYLYKVPEDRLVVNQGKVVWDNSTYNLNDCKYILSYTPGHWVAYRKEGNKWIEYNTSSPNQRTKYTLDEIINKYKNTIPQYHSNYTPSKTSFDDFNYTPKNTYDIKKYSPKNPYIPKLPDIPPLKYHPYYYPRQNINYYQQYYYPYRNSYQYQYKPLTNFPLLSIRCGWLFNSKPYYYPRQNINYYQPYYYPYRNSYQYQYKPLTNFPLLSIRCGWLFNLNTIPSISQSQFYHH